MRNKPRIYLAVYARLKIPNSYHYAIHITPKQEASDPYVLDTTKYNCRNQLIVDSAGRISHPWKLEVMKINPSTDDRLLCRVLLGKVKSSAGNFKAVENLFMHVPIFQDDKTYNCVAWVRLALVQLDLQKLVSWAWPGGMEGDGWAFVDKTALNYVKSKKSQGRYENWNETVGLRGKVPTYDMILARESIP